MTATPALTPHMQAVLIQWNVPVAPKALTSTTGNALVRRGLVTDIGNAWYRLTEAGADLRSRLIEQVRSDAAPASAREPMTWLQITDHGRRELAEHLRTGLECATEAERSGSALYSYVLSFVESLEGRR